MSRIKCFFAKPTERVRRYRRRYSSDETCPGMPGNFSYHAARTLLDEIEVPVPDGGYETDDRVTCRLVDEEEKPNFPTKCDKCDFLFPESAPCQIFTERLYQNEETGELYSIRELPPGAMYYGDWMLTEGSNLHRGPDGHCLMVMLPDGHPWTIDGRANNCTMPEDREHKCWVRHGMVPEITVDKSGFTCAAGAGSIATSKYHGFLRNGYLEEC